MMPVPSLAHQGGWDEFWLPAGIVVLIVGFALSRRKKRRDGGVSPSCLYCGRDLPPEAERCEACGFKRKGTA